DYYCQSADSSSWLF
nr:immunoglobulin light chain junction region [Macaca mulatta]